ncbi:putative sodium-coupled neutral amino acid transporter 10 [Melanaphis sacchari]|uniref:putative sodium-coupled neutral amino acid transporter 10 n=1 Tax=Melanaphis sacchari TaxID=742174 RepID=UPI000DC15974|nr:putative sodium-coupled neutral amino acid transporter 10 [Melanaphis sacchari]XP_025195302.1 putative sodium-coupled neutral amino acid transporter 10 [Melanaphis sacchari]
MRAHVMTLANSIIGVSILAMPFCYKECGIILSTLLLVLSNLMSRASCHFLLKSAIKSRTRDFEFLAFHLFGKIGKVTVELSIILFLMGTCIAFFVVMGDLGPQIIGDMLNIKNTTALRPSIMIGLAAFVVLPLGLLRDVNSLNTICTAAIIFYACLVFKIFVEAFDKLFSSVWVSEIYFWKPVGLFQCLPIFSMSLFCQTQLFDIFETITNESLDKLNAIIRSSMNMCTSVYISVGILGYIAYYESALTGNILTSFSQCLSSDIIKIGFVMSIAVSFPLVIFPCRSSIYSLLATKDYVLVSGGRQHIAETPFKCITFFIVLFSLVTGLLMPNIEVVLGLIGSTIGVMINVMFPSMFLVRVANKSPKERFWARFIFFVGIFIMVMGTSANLYAIHQTFSSVKTVHREVETLDLKPMPTQHGIINPKLRTSEEIRVEPPIPVEPVAKSNSEIKEEKLLKVDSGNTISKDAINKEDEELEKRPEIELLEKLKSHENEEKKILAESKQILEELKGARQVQLEKNKKKTVNNVKELKLNNKQKDKKNDTSLDEKKNQLVKDKMPLPLVLKEANKPNKKKIEVNRDKRDLTSTVESNNEEKEENCNKNEKVENKDFTKDKNIDNKNIIENVSVTN